MLNSVAAGRRLACRTVGYQAIATVATALVCLVWWDAAAALGALAGGGAVSLGSGLAVWRAMGGGVIGSGAALLRLVGATALKWMAVVAGLFLALSVWKLPPGPVIAAAVVAVLAWLPAAVLAGRSQGRKTGRTPEDVTRPGGGTNQGGPES